jgi:hypothetical protein
VAVKDETKGRDEIEDKVKVKGCNGNAAQNRKETSTIHDV